MILMCFIEGIMAFVSPCVLPLVPLYISYLGGNELKNKKKLIINSIGFVLGFTIIFSLLGLTATTIGSFLTKYKDELKYVSGALIIVMGISFLIPIKIFLKEKRIKMELNINNIYTAILFGMIFSIGWTPCVGPLLASALVKAANTTTMIEGVILLISFSLGLGIPFILTSILYSELVNIFKAIKNNLDLIKKLSGAILIVFGVIMILGLI
jgi:cytochrome c-type biogenesis protein